MTILFLADNRNTFTYCAKQSLPCHSICDNNTWPPIVPRLHKLPNPSPRWIYDSTSIRQTTTNLFPRKNVPPRNVHRTRSIRSQAVLQHHIRHELDALTEPPRSSPRQNGHEPFCCFDDCTACKEKRSTHDVHAQIPSSSHQGPHQ